MQNRCFPIKLSIDGPIKRRQDDATIYLLGISLAYRHVDLRKIPRGNRVISGENNDSPSGDGYIHEIRDNVDAAEQTMPGVPLKS